MQTTYYQSTINSRAIHAVRRYACGHFHTNTWLRGNKLSGKMIRVSAKQVEELVNSSKLISIRKGK